jgi:flagellar protein FlgJ
MNDLNLSTKIGPWHYPNDRGVSQPAKSDLSVQDRAKLETLRKACKDFESILVHMLLKNMRATLPRSKGAGMQEEIYTSIGDLELARSVAHGRGLGLGDMLFRELSKKVQQSNASG